MRINASTHFKKKVMDEREKGQEYKIRLGNETCYDGTCAKNEGGHRVWRKTNQE